MTNSEARPSWAADAIERRPITSLRAADRNPRTHSENQTKKLRKSLRQYGWTTPILIRKDGQIVAGHGRWGAAMAEYADGNKDFAEIPCMIVPDWWTAEQIRAYVIADNAYAEDAGWDEELLKLEIADLSALGFDMELTGFDLDQIEGIGAFGDIGALLPSGNSNTSSGALTARFLVAPFSVLNAREGWWQNRKRQWIALGIQSELGRGENALGFSETILSRGKPKGARHKANAEPRGGGGGVWAAHNAKQAERKAARASAKPRGNALRARESMAEAAKKRGDA